MTRTMRSVGSSLVLWLDYLQLFHTPLGLTIAPNGDILSVNGGDGNIVETTPDGHQVAIRLLDKTAPVPTGGAGTLFGVAVVPGDVGVYYVDDGDNTLRILN